MNAPSVQFLERIVRLRRQRVEESKRRTPVGQVRAAAERRHERRDFARAICAPGLSVIAELKQASPSRGVLRHDYRCREIAQGYEAAGAAALSVLTEEDFFHGSLTDLIDTRDAVGLPVLRKDFVLDAYQIYESVAAGADALLLIVAALSDSDLAGFLDLTREQQIAALTEVHTAEDLRRAVDAGAGIIGINNRDLATLEVTLETSFRLRDHMPSECISVSESGIKTASDLKALQAAGFEAVLVGEHFMTSPDPGRALEELTAADGARL